MALAFPEGPVIHTATRVQSGRPFPLGALSEENGTNFALFSENGTKVELCIFDETGEHEIERIVLPEHTDGVWHGSISNLGAGTVYGYRVYGPYEPKNGHRFNPNKLLLDPYSRAYVGELSWDPAVFGYTLGHEDGDLSFDERDSAPFVPKCVVVPRDEFSNDRSPSGHLANWEDTVIYEMHVKGYTKQSHWLPDNLRGTYAGLADKSIVKQIKALGVTSVELLPVHTFLSDAHLIERGLTNYWGYNTLGFFVPDQRYASSKARCLPEFKAMVNAYHDAGLEVILDVVYNHTPEGNELGATLSYKGIDNASYYHLSAENKRYYVNDTGTGNTLNISHPRVVQMVTDSLRYWVQEMQVDGFRFDLATILARSSEGFDPTNGFLNAVRQDPILATVKLIAEPWDCGPGGYQVGGFPPGWAEWNDNFRNVVRDFWRGNACPSELAGKLLGSPAQFQHDGRRAWSSINFVTAHDGFTLKDLVSYNGKHNEANGEQNSDGTGENRSWNCGAEGTTNDQDVLTLRARQMRNIVGTLLLSQGTPMLLAGDERANTQEGNNNAYCQDNAISWIDWNDETQKSELTEFVKRAIKIRRRFPVLHSTKFATGFAERTSGVGSVLWISATGDELQEHQWDDPNMQCFGMRLDANAITDQGESDASLLLMFNAYHDVVEFTMPPAENECIWRRVLDTNIGANDDEPTFASGTAYGLTGRSFAVFEQKAPIQ